MTWGPREDALHPRDRSNGEFVHRTSALLAQPAAEAWAFEQWVNSEHYGTLERHFAMRDRLVEQRMRELVEPAEFRAWYNERLRQRNARERRQREMDQIERERRRHRTYREKRDRGRMASDERIRTVRKANPVRVKVQRPGLTGLSYRRLTPTRFQPGRWGVFVDER